MSNVISNIVEWGRKNLSDHTEHTVSVQDDLHIGAGLAAAFDAIFQAVAHPASGVLVKAYPTAPYGSGQKNWQIECSKAIWANRYRDVATPFVHLPPELCGYSLSTFWGEAPANAEKIKILLFPTIMGYPFTYDGSDGIGIAIITKPMSDNGEAVDLNTGEVLAAKPVDANQRDTMTTIGFAPFDLMDGPSEASLANIHVFMDSMGAAVAAANQGQSNNFVPQQMPDVPDTKEQLAEIARLSGIDPR